MTIRRAAETDSRIVLSRPARPPIKHSVIPVNASRNLAADRWLAVGQSGDVDARRAGQSAAAQALAGSDPKLLIVFCCEAYDLPELVEGVREVAGDTPLIGCSTAGEISTAGPGDAGVVVTALGGNGFDVATAAADAAGGRLREAGAEVAGCIDGVADKAHRVLLLLTDGLAGDQAEIVRGAYRVAGAEVPLVGGCAGGAPVAGFYTYGEIARTHGISGFHNQTLVVLAVA